ncbi:MAG TPA: hypothetical protein VGH16_00695 [Candidatus Binatia bacterium]
MDLESLAIGGMAHDGRLLWLAAPEERLVAAHDPESGKTEARLSYAHEVWDVCPAEDGVWLLTAGGKLDRQIVFWSFREEREKLSYGCPDGAGSGLALYDEKLWLPHRHNRKLFCIDPKSGKTNWVVRTQHETFSPAAYRNELWLIESDPGPLAHWSDPRHARYFFARYDPTRETIIERVPVPFAPCAMAPQGSHFWYAEIEKKGIAQVAKKRG